MEDIALAPLVRGLTVIVGPPLLTAFRGLGVTEPYETALKRSVLMPMLVFL